jgi:hypothetical protein
MKFKTFNDLERYVENTLVIPEKDFKKYLIFNILVPATSIKQLNDIPLSGLIDLMKKEGKL